MRNIYTSLRHSAHVVWRSPVLCLLTVSDLFAEINSSVEFSQPAFGSSPLFVTEHFNTSWTQQEILNSAKQYQPRGRSSVSRPSKSRSSPPRWHPMPPCQHSPRHRTNSAANLTACLNKYSREPGERKGFMLRCLLYF